MRPFLIAKNAYFLRLSRLKAVTGFAAKVSRPPTIAKYWKGERPKAKEMKIA
jgi:hypothetical protein